MAFHPKSNIAIGLPSRRNQTLSDHLDIGMKSFLRQTPLSNATMVLRQSWSKYNQQASKLNDNKINSKSSLKKNNSLNNMHSQYKERKVSAVYQTAAKAFPSILPKSSHVGMNSYENFVRGLNCNIRRRKEYLQSLTREKEQRRLTILNNLQTPREEVLSVRIKEKNQFCKQFEELSLS